MRPRRDPVPRAKDAWVWLGGTALLGFLGAGLVGAAMLLWENIDVRQLAPRLVAEAAAPLPSPEPARPPAVEPVSFSAVLFDSPRNRDQFADSDHYGRELAGWRALIGALGARVRTVSDAEGLRAAGTDEVLVLAEAPCVSRAELAAVRAHLARGGGLVANWAVGTRDGSCSWRGWETVLELTGAEGVQEIRPADGLFMTVPAGIALGSGLDPGTRIELHPEPSLALRTPGPRVYWSDWALNPRPDPSGLGTDVAAQAMLTATGGRSVWLAARAGQAATPTDSVRLRRLLQNGVRWAAGVASASVASWPGGARAALVYALDVEDQPRNAIAAADFFRRRELPVSFFAVSRLVHDDHGLAATLAATGEIGSQTVDHMPLAGLTAQDQSVRLQRSWTDVEEWAGVGPAGLRPPADAYDVLTLSSWRRVGGRYVLALNESRSASPEIHRTEVGAIVLLPRLLKDDYHVVVQDGALRSERIGDAWLAGARKMRAIGGLAVVAGHTQIMDGARRLDAFRVVADTAAAQGDWWIARADQVAAWWSARADVELRFSDQPSGAGVADLIVRGGSGEALADVWIDVVLPRTPGAVIPLVDGRSVAYVLTDWGMRVPAGTLEPGAEHRISFVPADGEG